MKKRTLAILLIVVLVLAGIWLAREQTAQETTTVDQPQVTSCLIALDEVQQANAAQAEAENDETQPEATAAAQDETAPDKDGVYTTKDDVAAYIAAYGALPNNFMTKDEARDLGWSGGGLDDYSYGMCIGGDSFGNYEGLLPEANGRRYYECDVDTLHADDRGAKRIVFSNDGLIYYTDDHYESFTLLYGTP